MKALGIPLRRPVATGAFYFTLLLLGLTALQDLPLALAPDLDHPRLSVTLRWSDASPEDMEALVTSRIESEVHLLEGVHEVNSVSGSGWAEIGIAYERDTDMDRAEILLFDRLTSVRDELPETMSAPVVDRWLPDGRDTEDFFVFMVSGPRTAETLRALLERLALPRLTAIDGVAGAEILGGSPPELRVDLDPEAIQRGLAEPGRLQTVLDRLGTDRSLGSVSEGTHRVPVVGRGSQPRSDVLVHAVVGGTPDRPVRLGEVASVRDTWAEATGLARLNGMPSIQVVIQRESGTNLIQVARAVRRQVDAVSASLPADIKTEVVMDQSESIQKELSILAQRSAWSLLFIFVVLLVAQRRLPSAIAVLSSVVFSALATFLMFRVVGLGIDLVTLSGLALAFGMAVDNSIVLLENVQLRTKRTLDPVRLLAAAREVQFPLLAGALTTAVVMTPFLYLTADLKDYYLPFVLAVCLSLTASLVVAFTLTPLLARWSEAPRAPSTQRWWERGRGERIERAYDRMLRPVLRHPWPVPMVAMLVFGGSIWLFQSKVDKGSIFPSSAHTSLVVSIGLPPGAEILRTDEMIRDFEEAVLEHPYYAAGYLKQVRAMIRENRGMLWVEFHPAVARTGIPGTLKEEMILRAATIAGAAISVSGSGPGYNAGGGSVSASYRLRVRGPDYLRLAELAEDVGGRLDRHPRIHDVNTNASSWMAKDAIEFAAVPRREQMAELGVTMRDVSGALQPALGGRVASRTMTTPGGDLLASIRWSGGDAQTSETLLAAGARTANNTTYPFREVLSVEERRVQREIRRLNQEYERSISFEYKGPGRVGNRYLKAFLAGTEVPPGYTLEESRGTFLTNREEQEIHLAIGLSLMLIYMVSAALFESLLLPFVALLAVPLSFSGVAAVFWLTGESFDRTAYIGLILLAGIAINNALLLVHRAGVLHRRTRRAAESMHRAARERFRPILLTTATSLAGLAPLIWGIDPEGAASWRSMAIAASAGLLTSAVITLLVIPPLFLWFMGRRRTPAAIAPHHS